MRASLLATFLCVLSGRETVVGRKGKVRRPDVTQAFRRAGVNAEVKR